MREIQKNVFLVCCKILAVVFTGRSHLIVCTGICAPWCAYVKTKNSNYNFNRSSMLLFFSLLNGSWIAEDSNGWRSGCGRAVGGALHQVWGRYHDGSLISWLLWSCQLFGIQVFSLGLPSWKIFFFLSWFLYDFGSLITVPVRYLFFLHILLCAKFTKTLIRSRPGTGSFLKCFFVIWLSFDRYLTGSEKLQSGELLSVEDTYSKILHFKVWIIEF